MNAVTQRSNTLKSINLELAGRGLRPIRKLGDISEGEIEITAIKEIYEHSARFFTDVKFAVLFPGGKEGEFTVRFNANGSISDGAVIVALVNGRVAIVKQWRLPLSQWTYEVPRGFGDKLDKAIAADRLDSLSVADLPLGTLARELGDEIMKNAVVKPVAYLGNIAENSGTSNITPTYFLVEIEVNEEKLTAKTHGTEETMKVYFWDFERVQAELGLQIMDNHSIVALALAKRHIDTVPAA